MPSSRKCPICFNNDSTELFNHPVDNFDGIEFNRHLMIVVCDYCGAVYNDVELKTDTLEHYYKNETFYSGPSGFGTGGMTPADINRYSRYLSFISKTLLSKDSKIADVGCGKGGFLLFLREHGFTGLYGVEIDSKCVAHARNSNNLNVDIGSATDIPFDDNTFDMIICNHVLEHMEDPQAVIGEARRVLKDDGVLFIEVPDASGYSNGRVFDFFWFCMREHINHFDNAHLLMLLERGGFAKIDEATSLMPYNVHLSYPSLMGLYKKTVTFATIDNRREPGLAASVQQYIALENKFVESHSLLINELIRTKKGVYCWGIGLEFFALYSLTGLRRCNILGLVDKNTSKQKCSVNGIPIIDPSHLQAARPDSVVIIASVFNRSEMAAWLDATGYRGTIVFIDSVHNDQPEGR